MELSREEKELVLKYRLSKMELEIDNQQKAIGVSLALNDNADLIFSFANHFEERVDSVILNNEGCKKLYQFLKNRHVLIRELNTINLHEGE